MDVTASNGLDVANTVPDPPPWEHGYDPIKIIT